MRVAELIEQLTDLLEKAKKPCEECQEFDCDYCPVEIVWKDSVKKE